MSGIITYYYKHNCNIYLETVAKLSKWMLVQPHSHLSVGLYHTDLAKMLPDAGIDGEVCIQCALKLTNVDLGC